MSSVVISGDTSGSITVAAPAVAGTYTNTLPQITGTLSTLDRATAVTASGTSVDFTVPANVKRITVMFSGVSFVGATTALRFRLGTSGGVATSGYLGSSTQLAGTVQVTNPTAGFDATTQAAADLVGGSMVFTNLTGNTWTLNGSCFYSSIARTTLIGGSIALADVLTTVRITTVAGTDTFDAGSINILYE